MRNQIIIKLAVLFIIDLPIIFIIGRPIILPKVYTILFKDNKDHQ